MRADAVAKNRHGAAFPSCDLGIAVEPLTPYGIHVLHISIYILLGIRVHLYGAQPAGATENLRFGRPEVQEKRMARMTRAQSREQTRKKLIDAARAAFAQKGYGATTIDQIAEDAGFSKGAFYSNFNSKDDLALEIVYTDVTTRLEQWITMVCDRASDGPEAVVAALRAGADAVNTDIDRDRLHLELIL